MLFVAAAVVAIFGYALYGLTAGGVHVPTDATALVILGVIVGALCTALGVALSGGPIHLPPFIPPVVPPGPIPPPGPDPGPDPGPTPVPNKPRNTGILATSFGGPSDPQDSAYGGVVNPAMPGVALPNRFAGDRPKVRCFLGGKTVDCAIVDVGPWYPSAKGPADIYWPGTRPRAETDSRTNGAGIDLTPAAWAALGKTGNLDQVKDTIDWDFVEYLDAVPASPIDKPIVPLPAVSPLDVMKQITGTHEVSGSGDNPVILSWATAIGKKYPEMASYCARYQHDETAWCGLTVAYCMAMAGIRPQFGPTDTDKFLWADSWRQFGTAVTTPQPGDVLTFKWSNGGHHVTLYDHETDGDQYACRGGNQSDMVNVTMFPVSACTAIRRPT